MSDLRQRFGRLVAAHRRRVGKTQQELADAAGVGVDMISKIETGVTGVRFPLIERLAAALEVDPAALFSAEHQPTHTSRAWTDLLARLAGLTEDQLVWLQSVIDAALSKRPNP